MTNGNILIIDDEDKLRGLLARIIGLEGYQVFEAPTGKAGLRLLEKEPIQLVLSDVKLPDSNGIELTAKIKTLYPAVEIIVLTAYGTISDGVTAMKNGAFDYLIKGDDNDKIIPLVSRAMEKAALQQRVLELEKQVSKQYSFDTILGHSTAIKQAKDLADRVAPTDSTVLLEGETGSGKELFAQAIHGGSSRNTKPFVAVNCSAFPKDLLESEIFGYRKGAFSGALTDKKGLFEEANGGTLFLDEIGELPLELQAKFLRVLESQTFTKLGDTKPVQVNVRMVAATNRNLQQEAAAGHFRLDLYYRLSSFKITVPPLRVRKTDIPEIATFFMHRYAAKLTRRINKMDAAFVQKLQEYAWQGNIRELKNVIERAVILADSDTLTLPLLPPEFQQYTPLPAAELSETALSTMERNHIFKILQQTQGNKTETARLLHIGLTTLYRKIQEYNL
ncbi:sigma-54-dependent transcriptional regulator [Adhaeribacter pallidiroseus]|uniref:Putative 14.6 kDa protein in sodA1 3'region n=1 Tax=Adhaeribacter pallidiroseus TaxID=2072847 RepID=A0A369QR86_9BACT|nr:sigma-54 dependent transcriptional regulator [Adhaeribacter pallidiroseus]RDC65816.1 putative 14.6 kDa protein in sodA1 3'region [Adhaeribacter pallidiroseus]